MKKLLLFSGLLFTIFQTSANCSVSRAVSDVPDIERAAPELVLQTGHSKVVMAVVFGPDNRWVASGSFDNTIKIWDFDSGRELRSLAGHSGAIKALACSPDGKWLASGGNDGTVLVWEVETGRIVWSFDSNNGSVEALSFSPDGKWLASGGSGRSIRIHAIETGKELVTLPGHISSVSTLAFSPNGGLLASGGDDGGVRIWDVDKKKLIRDLRGHTRTVTSLCFNGSGLVLASGSGDKMVRLWKMPTGDNMGVLKGHAGRIAGLYCMADNTVTSVDSGRVSKVWNLSAKREVVSILNGSGTDDELEAATFSVDGKFLAAGNGNGTVTLSDAKTGQKLRILENHTSGSYGVAFSADRRWLASASFDNTVKLWDLEAGQSSPPLKGHTGYVTCVVFHPDNHRVISSSIDQTIRIWDTQSRSVDILNGRAGSISSLAVGSKGRLLVSGGADQNVGMWDLQTKTKTATLNGHAGEVISVSISPDERLIASASMDATIKIWDVSTGLVLHTLEPRAGEMDAVAFSPDGSLLASGGVDKAVRIWETATGRLVSTLIGHTAKINAVSFSPDGKQIVSASQDKTTRIWNADDGAEARTLVGHVGTVFYAAFSSDGKWLASASEDGGIIIWKKNDGKLAATLISIKDSNDWLVVSPEGFFDGSPPSWNQLAWRFERSTFNVKPVEVFFNEFYSPGLLADIFADRKLPSNTTISDKDRRQPRLTLGLVYTPVPPVLADREIKVKIDISLAAGVARDLRLFRNGSLVKVWHGDVLNGQNNVTLEATIPRVAGENKLTAYAFNQDNVKSSDATLIVTGADRLKRKGIAYILAVGIDQYSNAEYNLAYAVSDARDFAAELKRQQEIVGNYDHVEVISLHDKDATKANILKALAIISAKIRPEDSLTIYFAGHGTAQANRFYLIAHDLGYTGSREKLDEAGLKTILAHGISDEELEAAVEEIDVGRMLLVIDACNSGQALEAEEKRRGPMNSKGLAQLAYEKGMYILTASQSYQAAKEAAKLGHGFLTYALVEEGLKTRLADKEPRDGQLLLREWLDYATSRVPEIQQDEIKDRQLIMGKPALNTTGRGDLQHPRVFYRRETEEHPFIVARP